MTFSAENDSSKDVVDHASTTLHRSTIDAKPAADGIGRKPSSASAKGQLRTAEIQAVDDLLVAEDEQEDVFFTPPGTPMAGWYAPVDVEAVLEEANVGVKLVSDGCRSGGTKRDVGAVADATDEEKPVSKKMKVAGNERAMSGSDIGAGGDGCGDEEADGQGEAAHEEDIKESPAGSLERVAGTPDRREDSEVSSSGFSDDAQTTGGSHDENSDEADISAATDDTNEDSDNNNNTNSSSDTEDSDDKHDWQKYSGAVRAHNGDGRCHGLLQARNPDHASEEDHFFRCKKCRLPWLQFEAVCEACMDKLELIYNQTGSYPLGYECLP